MPVAETLSIPVPQSEPPMRRDSTSSTKTKAQVLKDNIFRSAKRLPLTITASALAAGALFAGGILIYNSDGSSSEGVLPTSTPTPEASATPSYDLQMPPKPPVGASCTDVLGELTSAAGDKNYFPAGAGLIFDVKSFSSDPEHTSNGTIIVDTKDQAKFNSIVASEEPKLEAWSSNTQVAGELRIDWMAGELSEGPEVYTIWDNIKSPSPSLQKGVVCLTKEGVTE